MDSRYEQMGVLSEGLIPVENVETALCGFVDEKGNVVIEPVYREAYSFSEGLADVKSAETGKWGFIDRTGAVKIPFIFDGSLGFNDGIAFVHKDGMIGCIDKDGKEVFPISVPKSVFDYLEDVHDFFLDEKPLNSIPCRSFNSETIKLFEFIAENKIRARVQELTKGKKLSKQARDVLEEKIQEKITKAKTIIQEKIKQNICRNEIGDDIVEELDSII